MPKLKDLVPGGKGDKTLTKDVDPKQLVMGIKVEMEHTNNREEAEEIAKDHLTEDPKYYSKLKGAGLADELDESAVGDKIIEIGETISEISESFVKLELLLYGMNNKKIDRNFDMAKRCINQIKLQFEDIYNFGDK